MSLMNIGWRVRKSECDILFHWFIRVGLGFQLTRMLKRKKLMLVSYQM